VRKLFAFGSWLFDIIQSIEEIESYFAEQPQIFENYIKEIIGEATNRIYTRALGIILK